MVHSSTVQFWMTRRKKDAMQQKDPIPRDPRARSAGKRGGNLYLHLRGNPGYLRWESRPGIIEENLIDCVLD